jgi:hypothetical protein
MLIKPLNRRAIILILLLIFLILPAACSRSKSSSTPSKDRKDSSPQLSVPDESNASLLRHDRFGERMVTNKNGNNSSTVLLESGQEKNDKSATLEFIPANGEPVEVTFTPSELKEFDKKFEAASYFKKNLEFLEKKLNSNKVKCCEERTKLVDCVWMCCNGDKVKTCDSRLQKALDLLWLKDNKAR